MQQVVPRGVISESVGGSHSAGSVSSSIMTFSASVNNAEVSVAASVTVEPGAKAELPIEWRPLLPKETTSQLSLTSAELGDFTYDLRLQALPAGETKSMAFKCASDRLNRSTSSAKRKFVNREASVCPS